jgi:hypothetical protein
MSTSRMFLMEIGQLGNENLREFGADSRITERCLTRIEQERPKTAYDQRNEVDDEIRDQILDIYLPKRVQISDNYIAEGWKEGVLMD